MSKRITYGVRGIIEWHAKFRSGRCTFPADFTGGTLDGYGVRPAEFTTDNPVMKFVIERSPEFKCGRITKLREHSTEAPAAQANTTAPAANTTAPAAKPKPAKPKLERIAVASIDDARQYLVDNHQTDIDKIKTKAAIAKVAEGFGIEFVVE